MTTSNRRPRRPQSPRRPAPESQARRAKPRRPGPKSAAKVAVARPSPKVARPSPKVARPTPAPASTSKALVVASARCDFDRVDSTTLFATLGGIRALEATEASQAICRQTLLEQRGYDREDLMAIAEVGYHYIRNGGWRLAEVIFEGLTAIDPDEAYFFLALGLAKDHLEDKNAARRAYETAVRLDPSDPTPELNLAELELEAGRRAAAHRRTQAARDKAARIGQAALVRKAEALLSLNAIH